MKLQRFLSILLTSSMMLTGLVGCNSPSNEGESSAEDSTAAETHPMGGETAVPETTPPELETVAFTESKISGRFPNQLTMTAEDWTLSLVGSSNGLRFQEGHFGEMEVTSSPVFSMIIRDENGAEWEHSSTDRWGSVSMTYAEGAVTIILAEPKGVEGLSVELTGQTDGRGISWYTKVTNESAAHTVMSIYYPTPELKAQTIHVFLPEHSGRTVMNAQEVGCSLRSDYPGYPLSMPYFAYWGENSGIYLGVHDPDGSMKTFTTEVVKSRAKLTAKFPAIGAGNAGNSFDVGGCIRWEVFEGDWYDATMIYADFVHNHANWLPEKGRPDMAEKFKEIAAWTVDYSNDDTLNGALRIRESLGYPTAVHSYFWHQIDFDTLYPHFLPAKENTAERFARLREAGIYVVPYINGAAWGTLDAAAGYETNYDNTGVNGVALFPDGVPRVDVYANPLAVMCPGFKTWHGIMNDLVRGIESELPVDGVYFDLIAATVPIPCSSPNHGHVPGGGSYWTDGYNDMVKKLKAGRPAESFYMSESSGETYVKTFDGLLCWKWAQNDLVPAFPAIYAGYVQMVGRESDSVGTENAFRYHFGEAVLFGQQPGWFYGGQSISDERLAFMKQVVDARMQYIDLFNYGKLMRPPVVETEIAPVDGYRQVISGVWQAEDGGKTVLFVINVSEQATTATVNLYPTEYGVDCEAAMAVELEPMSVKVIELN